jgi:hypothetical protein
MRNRPRRPVSPEDLVIIIENKRFINRIDCKNTIFLSPPNVSTAKILLPALILTNA